jgi:hypothetical protein
VERAELKLYNHLDSIALQGVFISAVAFSLMYICGTNDEQGYHFLQTVKNDNIK